MSIVVEVAATPPIGQSMIVGDGVVDLNTVRPDPVWQDVTCDVTSFSSRRGRDRDIGQVRAGSATLVLNNHDGDWTPVGAQTGRWWDQLEVGRAFRIRYQLGDVLVPLFTGTLTSYSFAQQGPALYVTAQLQDALGTLGFVVTPTVAAVGAGESASTRANRILDAAGWSGGRDVPAGDGAPLVAYTGNVNAASQLQDVAFSDQSLLFAAADGTVTWQPRNAPRTVTVEVTDRTDDESAVRAAALELPLEASDDTLVNRSLVRSADGGLTDGEAQSLTSVALYGPRDLQFTALLNVQSDVDALADVMLAGRDEPDLTFRSASFLVESKQDVLAERMLSSEVGATLEVLWTPPGESSPVRRFAQVEQVVVSARPGRTTLRWVLSDLTGRIPLQVGSSEFGVVGSQIVGW